MSEIKIYGKNSTEDKVIISNVEEHYCTNGMFYVKAKGQELYYSLEQIGFICVEAESENEIQKMQDLEQAEIEKAYELENAETLQDVLNKIITEIDHEADYAYADFDRYKEDILYAEADELPDNDFRYGLRRAIEIINKYKRRK